MKTLAWHIIPLVFIAIVLSGCEHKKIHMPSSQPQGVHMMLMWDRYPDANPQGMTLYFFPLGGGKIWRYDTPGRDGGDVELPIGRYSMLAFNNDLPGVAFSGLTSLSAAKAALRLSSGAATGSGALYCGVVERLEVTPCGVEYSSAEYPCKECPAGLVRCSPQPRFCSYTLVLEGVKGMERVRQASALLSPMAAEVDMASGSLSASGVGLAISLSETGEGDSMRGATTAFGVASGADRITATVRVVRTDGVALAKAYDVTDQVLSAPDPRNVTIVIRGLEIPDGDTPLPPDPDVGIDVDVDGWSVIYIDMSTDNQKQY